jgi:hypothetical protein
MKNIKIVFEANGEISGTYGPICFLENFTGNINEKTTKLISHDFWEPREVDKYKIYEVSLPDWMNETKFLRNEIQLKWNICLTSEDFIDQLSEQQFNNFSKLPEKTKFLIGWMFDRRKNNFLNSLYTQVEKWLNLTSPKYNTPLSRKQFEAASRYCPLWEAKQISTRLYYSK